MRWTLRGKTWSAALLLLGALVVSACGATSSPLGGGAAAPTATSGSSALVATSSANVSGTAETVLTNAQGMTLYYFDRDTSTSVACTGGGGYGSYGGCTRTWPPLPSPGGAAPTSSVSLSGSLSVLNDANGQQVMYNGHPLYTYSGDQNPGDTNGNGIQGLWHVATPSLASGSAPASGPTATPSGGYGGYGG